MKLFSNQYVMSVLDSLFLYRGGGRQGGLGIGEAVSNKSIFGKYYSEDGLLIGGVINGRMMQGPAAYCRDSHPGNENTLQAWTL
jgi:hypothetical protein